MTGARLDGGSPSSSDDESVSGSGGGAPLWSPQKGDSSNKREAVSAYRNMARITSTTDNASNNKYLSALSGFADEEDPKTPSDQATESPLPLRPSRSFSKSTLRAATEALLKHTDKPVGPLPPSLSLSTYPGPSTGPQRQPSLPLLVPVPPIVGGIPVSIGASTSQAHAHPSLPGSTTHSFISAMQAMNLNAEEDNLHPAQKTHRDQICKLQARIWGLRQGMYRQASIPHEFLTSFDYDVQELMNNTVRMNQAIDSVAEELKKALAEQQRVRGLEATIRDLEGDLKDWKERFQSAEKTMASIAGRGDEDMRTIQFLKEQLRQNEMARTILQEQVTGKRNLWLNVHTDPQERAAAMDSLARSSTSLSGQTFPPPADHGYPRNGRAPGSVRSSSSHTTSVQSSSARSGTDRALSVALGNGNPNFPGGFGNGPIPYPAALRTSGYSSSPFRAIPQSQSGPAVFHGHQRRPSNATATSGQSSANNNYTHHSGAASSRPSTGPRRHPRVSTIAETGSPVERKRNSAPRSIVRPDMTDEESLRWADEFQSLFALIHGFCISYFHELPRIDADWKSHLQAEAKGDLWDYICRICQNGQEQERGDHAMRLLKDKTARPYFMQRLILQHILVFICSFEGWKDYSEDVDDEMERLEEELKAIDPLKTYDRQVVIDRRAELVTEMVESSNAPAFKNFKLTQHHQYLKTMVAPFLPKHKATNLTNEAFYDLFGITSTAFELSAKLFRSRLTFQYVWNDVGARFSAETHEPLDCSVDRHTLQYEHCRVKLCATPAVTMRNDRSINIDTKNILKSGVLVMRY